jgi:hypothetical protein
MAILVDIEQEPTSRKDLVRGICDDLLSLPKGGRS